MSSQAAKDRIERELSIEIHTLINELDPADKDLMETIELHITVTREKLKDEGRSTHTRVGVEATPFPTEESK